MTFLLTQFIREVRTAEPGITAPYILKHVRGSFLSPGRNATWYKYNLEKLIVNLGEDSQDEDEDRNVFSDDNEDYDNDNSDSTEESEEENKKSDIAGRSSKAYPTQSAPKILRALPSDYKNCYPRSPSLADISQPPGLIRESLKRLYLNGRSFLLDFEVDLADESLESIRTTFCCKLMLKVHRTVES